MKIILKIITIRDLAEDQVLQIGILSPFWCFYRCRLSIVISYDLIQNIYQDLHMEDDYFSNQAEIQENPPVYQPPQEEPVADNQDQRAFEEVPQPVQQNNQGIAFDFSSYPPADPPVAAYNTELADNEFNDFQEDEMTKKIREEQERVQNMLRDKSQQEYDQKNERKGQGRRQLQQFNERKEKQKQERSEDNIRKQSDLREEYKKLTMQAGWRKVISNINLKQGEHKGKKDITRMRESIQHKREDQSHS